MKQFVLGLFPLLAAFAACTKEGNEQGTVYLIPGTGSTVAEVIVSSEVRIKYFNKLSFILD